MPATLSETLIKTLQDKLESEARDFVSDGIAPGMRRAFGPYDRDEALVRRNAITNALGSADLLGHDREDSLRFLLELSWADGKRKALADHARGKLFAPVDDEAESDG